MERIEWGRNHRMVPMVRRYRGGPVPANARVEWRTESTVRILGPLLFGAIFVPTAIGAASALNAGVGFDSPTPWFLVPGAGPFIGAFLAFAHQGSMPVSELYGGAMLLAGIGEAIGALMTIFGHDEGYMLAYYEPVAARRRSGTRWMVSLGAGTAPIGLSLAMSHF